MNTWMQRFRIWIQKGKTILQDEKKRVNLLLCIGMAGLLLLAFSEWLPEEKSTEPETTLLAVQSGTDYAQQLQEKLQCLISQVEGAGKTEVMVTLASGEESIYATDSQTQADGSVSVNHVLQGSEGLIETVQTPRVLGVAVVCEGGGEASVQNRVSTLVQALTGVGANHITVAKMAVRN